MQQERLKSHAKSFDGLLSLIPAKYYYGEDTSVRSLSEGLGLRASGDLTFLDRLEADRILQS